MTRDSGSRATAPAGVDPHVVPAGLRTRAPKGALATGDSFPRLAWTLESRRKGVVQQGYELEVASEPSFACPESSGFVAGEAPFDAEWPAAGLQSREIRWCRVRVWTDRGRTEWSAPLRVEAALLQPQDWVARPVSPRGNVGRFDPVPVPLLRRSFHLAGPVARARLHVTALGIHATTLNGIAVSDDLFEPGWTAHPHRHLYATHDVTRLLRRGENVLAAAVGDGWWRGELTWMDRRAVYGETTALLAQLEIELADGSRVTVATDGDWRGATGGWLAADIYDGSTLDLRLEPRGWREPGFDDDGWEPVSLLDRPRLLEPRPMEAVRVFDTFEVKGVPSAWGTLLYDCGQNLTGWLRIRARGPAGATITVRHAEVLDDDGRLHTAALRRARATDVYVLDGSGEFELEPVFTFHGFRHAEICAEAGVEILRVEARVVTSDLEPTGSFHCSEPLLNRLWENIRWSQRGNFLAIPTDCPQRDERMGWTGDAQVFAPTACMNSDVRAFLASWLRDLALEQRSDGSVPSVVPNVIRDHQFAFGAVGWGDAATLVPWALYEAYGDTEILREQFGSMAAWVDWCASRLNADGLWEGDFQFGDWLDPGAPPETPHLATTSGDYIASAYLSHSAATTAAAARILGNDALARSYDELAERVADATWGRWRDHALTTQAGCAIAIELGIAPAGEHREIADRLAALVEEGDGRIATGFLGTPLLLPALTRLGRVDAAYRLLLNRAAPGWLYQVLRGATTVWERWDAIREDGSIHPGEMEFGEGASMMSFNHYAYGAVAAWLYRSLAGISPIPDHAGYRRILFAPRPGGGLSHARAGLRTAFGDAAVAWRLDGEESLVVELVIPPGSTGVFSAPPGWRVLAQPEAGAGDVIRSGMHRIALAPEHSRVSAR